MTLTTVIASATHKAAPHVGMTRLSAYIPASSRNKAAKVPARSAMPRPMAVGFAFRSSLVTSALARRISEWTISSRLPKMSLTTSTKDLAPRTGFSGVRG